MELNRRRFLTGAAATAGTLALPQVAHANAAANAYFSGYQEDSGFQYRRTNFKKIDPVWHRQMVKYFSDEPPGTVVVDTTL